jgi:hypothetical protein
MKKGEKMSKEQKEKIGKANSISLLGKKSWNSGLTKEKDSRVDYDRPTAFKKGIETWNKGKKMTYDVWNKGKKLSEAHRKSLKGKRPRASGKNNHNWKGGITEENNKIRTSFEYKLWRTAVFERDKYTCIWCGVKSGNGKAVVLHADHIRPFAYYPELRFAIDNGRTLCVDCHKTTDTYCGKRKPQ